jgi:hypothetical protein
MNAFVKLVIPASLALGLSSMGCTAETEGEAPVSTESLEVNEEVVTYRGPAKIGGQQRSEFYFYVHYANKEVTRVSFSASGGSRCVIPVKADPWIRSNFTGHNQCSVNGSKVQVEVFVNFGAHSDLDFDAIQGADPALYIKSAWYGMKRR